MALRVQVATVAALVVGSLLVAPGTASAASWTPPAAIAPATSSDAWVDVAVAPDGRAVVGLDRVDGSAQVAAVAVRDAPAGGFGPVQTISSGGEVASRSVDVAIDPQGNATAVWRRVAGPNPSDGRIEGSYRPAGGAWGPPQVLSGSARSWPSLAVGDNGAAVVVFSAIDADRQRVYAVTRGAGSGTFSGPAAISPAGAAGDSVFGDPDVGMDAAGDYVAVWQRLYDPDGSGSLGRAFYNEAVAKPVAAVPGEVRRLTPLSGGTAAYAPLVSVDPSGRAVIAFDYRPDGGQVTAQVATWAPGSTFATGSFSTAAAVSPGYSVAVSSAANGSAVVLASSGDVLRAVTRTQADAGFSQPLAVSSANLTLNGVAVAQSASGEAVIAWSVTEGDRVRLLAARLVPGSTSLGEVSTIDTLVVPSGGTARFDRPTVGLDSQGRAVLAYVATTGAGGTTTYAPRVALYEDPPTVAPNVPPATTLPAVGAVSILKVGRLKDGRTAIRKLRVTGVAKGDRVALVCRGRGCSKKATTSLTWSGKKSVKKLKKATRGLVLAPKATLTVSVARAGFSTRTTTWTMVRRKAPTVASICQDPGSSTTRAC